MGTDPVADIQKLSDLRASGAITQEQFERLSRSVLQSSAEERSSGVAVPTAGQGGRPQAPSLLRVAAAAGAGALAGALAADLVQNALADPPPEVVEAHVVESTTFTEDGYITHGEVTFENADGEIVGESTYVEEGSWVEPSGSEFSDAGGDVVDAGWDSGGADFGAF